MNFRKIGKSGRSSIRPVPFYLIFLRLLFEKFEDDISLGNPFHSIINKKYTRLSHCTDIEGTGGSHRFFSGLRQSFTIHFEYRTGTLSTSYLQNEKYIQNHCYTMYIYILTNSMCNIRKNLPAPCTHLSVFLRFSFEK